MYYNSTLLARNLVASSSTITVNRNVKLTNNKINWIKAAAFFNLGSVSYTPTTWDITEYRGTTLEVTMIYPYREQLDCHYIIKVFHSPINLKGNNLYPALYSALTLIFPNKADIT